MGDRSHSAHVTPGRLVCAVFTPCAAHGGGGPCPGAWGAGRATLPAGSRPRCPARRRGEACPAPPRADRCPLGHRPWDRAPPPGPAGTVARPGPHVIALIAAAIGTVNNPHNPAGRAREMGQETQQPPALGPPCRPPAPARWPGARREPAWRGEPGLQPPPASSSAQTGAVTGSRPRPAPQPQDQGLGENGRGLWVPGRRAPLLGQLIPRGRGLGSICWGKTGSASL